MADDNDDLVNPDDIESLLHSADTEGPPAGREPAGEESSRAGTPAEAEAPAGEDDKTEGSAPSSEPQPGDELIDPDDIEELLRQQEDDQPYDLPEEPSPAESPPAAENLLDQAEADLAAALAPNLESEGEVPPELGDAEPFQFQPFDSETNDREHALELDALQDVELDLRIELGRTELLIDEVLQLKEGSVVPLDKLAGDPVDILVNGRLIARGEVLVLNDNFCVRVAEILTPDF